VAGTVSYWTSILTLQGGVIAYTPDTFENSRRVHRTIVPLVIGTGLLGPYFGRSCPLWVSSSFPCRRNQVYWLLRASKRAALANHSSMQECGREGTGSASSAKSLSLVNVYKGCWIRRDSCASLSFSAGVQSVHTTSDWKGFKFCDAKVGRR
jgi:hypothetical protein